MTRFGVLGDVHCEDAAVSAALELFTKLGAERVLCVGDVVDGPGDVTRTIEALQRADCVAGNHDRWYLEGKLRDLPDAHPAGTLTAAQRLWLAGLPALREYDTPRGRLLLCHGLGADDMATLRPDDFGYGLENNDALNGLLGRNAYALVVSGHSHRRMVRRVGSTTFINAGTLLRGHEPCALVLDLEAATAAFFDWKGGAFAASAPISLAR